MPVVELADLTGLRTGTKETDIISMSPLKK